jgi:glycine cleavage system H lipoate-binding protein
MDDLIRKIFANIDAVKLPEPGRKVARGEKLFSVTWGDYSLDIPSPLSGTVISVNPEQAEHPEWLAIKPFELSWMCRLEPSALAAELPGMRIGHDAVAWYQQELDRYSELARNGTEDAAAQAAGTASQGGEAGRAGQLDLLDRFAKPFLQC